MLFLIALLPGGLVGTFAVMSVMGKAQWRQDALKIFAMSLIPAVPLGLLRMEWFPWPHWRDAVYVSGVPGLVFAVLQVWIVIKLLRQWWGEPDEYIPWWPPFVLVLQWLLLAGCIRHILTP